MTRSTSLFLDGLRVLAALTVFATHCVLIFYADAFWMPGHAAVVVFFVLSGYVIAYTSLRQPNLTVREYALARLSRLYSVVLPALVLSALTLIVGKALHLADYDLLMRKYEALRYVATALFVQSLWWRNLSPGENGPFWSLGYEFWYYVLWGGLIFIRSRRGKAGFVLVWCVITGPNILLLLPIWLLGAGLYLYGDRVKLSPGKACAGFLVALVLTAWFVFKMPEYPVKVAAPPWLYSGSFLTDWLQGLGVAMLIWFFAQAWGAAAVPPGLEKPIRWMAGHSFSLYLFHMPLILFVQALGIFDSRRWVEAVAEIGLILLFIAVLSELTESRRKSFQKWLARFWDYAAGAV